MRVQKLLLGAGLLLAAASPTLARDVVIDAGMLIDGTYPTPRQRMSILIKNDRIRRNLKVCAPDNDLTDKRRTGPSCG
jgi:hypothetical protein